MMAKKIVLYGLLLLVAGIGISFIAQPPLKDKVAENLAILDKYYPREKVYVQTDKDYYFTGRTIWYKAYVTINNRPTFLSSNLYIDLMDQNGKILQKQVRPIENGGSFGDFKIPENQNTGNYKVVAYTKWMGNFTESPFFEKDISIYELNEKSKSPTSAETAQEGTFKVQFFPEGGDLIDSVNAVVAFKATDDSGFPERIQGVVTTEDHVVVDSIKSVHDGMGSFSFTPKSGESYWARVKNEEGKEQTFELPKIKEYGVALSILKRDDDKAFFRVQRHVPDKELNQSYQLLVRSRNQLIYFTSIDFSKGLVGGMIPLKEFPGGVYQATLFSEANVPLSERIFFKADKEDLLNLTLKEDSVSLRPRGKNVFTVALPDSLKGTFSVAVTDADVVSRSPNQDNIVSSLLLSSEIKGKVFNPAWYFEKEDSATNHGLDLVMLTNGWRRFEWKALLKDDFPRFEQAPETRKIHFSGDIYGKKEPLPDAKINMFLRSQVDSVTYFFSGNADSLGHFEVDNLSFLDTANLFYKANYPDKKRRIADVKFDEEKPLQQGDISSETWQNDLFFNQNLNKGEEVAGNRNKRDNLISRRGILLKELDVHARKITKEETVDDRYTSGMFKSDNGYTFDLTNQHVPYTNILQYLSGRVPGLLIGGNPSNPSVRWRGGTPGFYLDEFPVDIDQIANVPVDDIALIKVYRPPFLGGFGGGSGGIAIYTKKGGDRTYEPGIGFQKHQIYGYSLVRKFYTPDYSRDSKLNELEDQRATLYWNPELKIDSVNHRLEIPFYNSDIGKKFRIILEGITEQGKIARIEKVIS